MKTFVIAEAGANHNRNFQQALKLIDIAKESGARACKFQTYSSKTLYSKNTPDFAGYQNINQLIKEIELPREWQKDLKQYCDQIDIEFMSTPFDEDAVDELINLGVKRLKIAGFESSDFRFVDMVASSKLPLIISLGIGFEDRHLDKILEITSKHGNDLTLLHCNNAYPTPIEDAHLKTIPVLLKKIEGCSVGFSDHTMSTMTPSLAVALGATVIEKHFTLSRHLPGPDHPFALEPDQLKEMVELIKQTEKALAVRTARFSSSEKAFSKSMRSVVAKCSIKKGEVLSSDNVTTKRPFLDHCTPASEYGAVIGSVAEKEYLEDDFI